MRAYANIRFTYLAATLTSILLMLGGWLWHLQTGDETNTAIVGGTALLILTPVLALVHLCLLSWARDKRMFWNTVTVIALVAAAFLLGRR